MKITKYFLTISEDQVFTKEDYLSTVIGHINTTSTTTSTTSTASTASTASTNTSLSASNCNQNLTSSLGSITATTIGAYIPSSWYNTTAYTTAYTSECIAYVDFFSCGLSLKLNSDNELKIDGLFYNGKKYSYIIDTKLKQNILIADLNYASFHEIFLDLTIKNLFDISELEI